VPELAGLLNSLLAISGAEMEHVLWRTHQVMPTLQDTWMRSLTETNPLAAWLDECVVYEPDGRTYIGVAKQDPVTRQYEGANTWLYANYRDYADASGQRKIVPLQSFRRLMEDLCQQQLKLPNVLWGRDDQGRYFDGLRLRRELDAKAPTLIEQAVALMVRGSSILESAQSPGSAETAGTITPGISATADAAGDAEVSQKVYRDPTHPIEASRDGMRVGPPVKESCAPTPACVAEFSIDAGLPPVGPLASPAGSARARQSPCGCCQGRRFWVTPVGRFICAACHPPASDALAIGWLELTDDAPGGVSRNNHKGRSIAGAPGPRRRQG
jgi:hypothetical protein